MKQYEYECGARDALSEKDQASIEGGKKDYLEPPLPNRRDGLELESSRSRRYVLGVTPNLDLKAVVR